MHWHFTYYPSTLGKGAVPVLMLHGLNGSRADYEGLAAILQKLGYAVVVPDLRGHGGTNMIMRPTKDKAKLKAGVDYDEDKIVAKELRKSDFEGFIYDLDTLKAWMLERNNAGEFNLNALALVGADWTCITAMNWAVRDWNAPRLINYKQGQDVKAAILLSPGKSHLGVDMVAALQHPYVGKRMSTLIVAGSKGTKERSEAERLEGTLKRMHNEANIEKDPKDRQVVYVPLETPLQGTKLLANEFKLAGTIAKFLEFRVKDKIEEKDFEYLPRQKP